MRVAAISRVRGLSPPFQERWCSMERPTNVVLPSNRGTGIRREHGTRARKRAQELELSVPLVILTKSPQKRAKSTAKKKPATARRKASAQRDFVISYDGAFIGHYRTEKRMTNKMVFQIIAHAMKEKLGRKFDLSKVELYKPVLLKCERPQTHEKFGEGTFAWFA